MANRAEASQTYHERNPDRNLLRVRHNFYQTLVNINGIYKANSIL